MTDEEMNAKTPGRQERQEEKERSKDGGSELPVVFDLSPLGVLGVLASWRLGVHSSFIEDPADVIMASR
jgi:hypothetical protein